MRDNLVSGNTGSGIELSTNGLQAAGADGPSGNVIAGNRVGTDKDGEAALGNGGVGVNVQDPEGGHVLARQHDRRVHGADAGRRLHRRLQPDLWQRQRRDHSPATPPRTADPRQPHRHRRGGHGRPRQHPGRDRAGRRRRAHDRLARGRQPDPRQRRRHPHQRAADGRHHPVEPDRGRSAPAAISATAAMAIDIQVAGANGNLIGGTGAGEGNTIAENLDEGVTLQDDATDNAILGNSIHSNGDRDRRSTNGHGHLQRSGRRGRRRERPPELPRAARRRSPAARRRRSRACSTRRPTPASGSRLFADAGDPQHFGEGETSSAASRSRPTRRAAPFAETVVGTSARRRGDQRHGDRAGRRRRPALDLRVRAELSRGLRQPCRPPATTRPHRHRRPTTVVCGFGGDDVFTPDGATTSSSAAPGPTRSTTRRAPAGSRPISRPGLIDARRRDRAGRRGRGRDRHRLRRRDPRRRRANFVFDAAPASTRSRAATATTCSRAPTAATR